MYTKETAAIHDLVLTTFVLLSFFLAACHKPAYISSPDRARSDNRLIAYYPFDVDATDSTGNGHDGRLMNDAKIVSVGKMNGALKLDGKGDYVLINTSLNLTNEFSLSCWINPEHDSRSDAAIFAKYETSRYGPYDFYLSYDRVAFWISDGTGSHKRVVSRSGIYTNKWTHVAWTSKDNVLRFFINGVLDSEATIPDMTTNNDKVTIGRQALLFTTSGNLEFRGMIDEVRLYERQLNRREIVKQYRSYLAKP